MKCEYAKVGDITAIVCSSGRRKKSPKCVKCGRLAMRQCDWKVGGAKSDGAQQTCDAWVCNLCTQSPGKGKDLCPEHAAAWASHSSNPTNKAKE